LFRFIATKIFSRNFSAKKSKRISRKRQKIFCHFSGSFQERSVSLIFRFVVILHKQKARHFASLFACIYL